MVELNDVLVIASLCQVSNMVSEVCGDLKSTRAIGGRAWNGCVRVEKPADCFPTVVAGLNGAAEFLEQFWEQDAFQGGVRHCPRFEIETSMRSVILRSDMYCDVGFVTERASAL